MVQVATRTICMLHELFIQRLKMIREQRGISQAAMAKRLKISQPAYAQYESGRICPSLYRIEQLAQILEIDATELLCSKKDD